MWAPESTESPMTSASSCKRGIDDLFGSLPKSGIDDFKTGIAECARNDFRAAVMPVESGLCNKDANSFRPSERRFLVDAIDSAKLVADFAERRVGANAIQNERHHVDVVGRSLPQGIQSSRDASVIACLAQLFELCDLLLGDGFVDQKNVDRRLVLA